jgi:hypothetical protein
MGGMGLGIGIRLGPMSGGSAAPFNPLSVSPVAWYDISDLASMFQTDLTTPAAVNSPVGKVNDKSGNGNHLIADIGASLPTLRQSGALYYLEFDGVDDKLRATFASLPQPYRRMTAMRQITWVSNKYLMDGGADDQLQLAQTGVSPAITLYAGSAVTCSNSDATVGSDVVLEQRLNGASSYLKVNAGTPTTGNPGANALTGCSFGGPASVDVAYANLRLYGELIGNFSDPQAASIRTYLGSKAGLSL